MFDTNKIFIELLTGATFLSSDNNDGRKSTNKANVITLVFVLSAVFAHSKKRRSCNGTEKIMVLGDDETECSLVGFKTLKCCLNDPIGQLSGFLLPPYSRQD